MKPKKITSRQETPGVRPDQYVSSLNAAKILGVSTFSVQRWFDEGLLSGARLPGGKRRISTESLRAFMIKHNMQASTLAGGAIRVLLITSNARQLSALRDACQGLRGAIVQTATSGLDAGLSLGEFKPDVMVLDSQLDGDDVSSLLRRLRQEKAAQGIRVVVVMRDPKTYNASYLRASGANAIVSNDVSQDVLVRAILG